MGDGVRGDGGDVGSLAVSVWAMAARESEEEEEAVEEAGSRCITSGRSWSARLGSATMAHEALG